MLLATIRNGPASLTWESEGFAVAAGYDENAGRYLGLVAGGLADSVAPTSLVVQPEVAKAQVAEAVEPGPTPDRGDGEGADRDGGPAGANSSGAPSPTPVTTFRGSVRLDGTRPVRHFGDISKEVLDHFAAQVGTDLGVTIEVVAKKPDGFTERVIRTVTENARTLRFDDTTGFSEE